MLANASNTAVAIGTLRGDVHKPGTFLGELVDFIAAELPVWRERPERPAATAETILTSQLCAHLASASRHAPGWDILQFRVEEADEAEKSRKVDIIAAANATTIIIEGRRYTDFDTLLPIECKRLPTPTNARRDEREYVICGKGSTGGIQRFKSGHHGKNHRFGAMIGYVQSGSRADWVGKVNGWIGELAGKEAGWTNSDLLTADSDDEAARTARLRSTHTRQNRLADIELRHIWIEMAS